MDAHAAAVAATAVEAAQIISSSFWSPLGVAALAVVVGFAGTVVMALSNGRNNKRLIESTEKTNKRLVESSEKNKRLELAVQLDRDRWQELRELHTELSLLAIESTSFEETVVIKDFLKSITLSNKIQLLLPKEANCELTKTYIEKMETFKVALREKMKVVKAQKIAANFRELIGPYDLAAIEAAIDLDKTAKNLIHMALFDKYSI